MLIFKVGKIKLSLLGLVCSSSAPQAFVEHLLSLGANPNLSRADGKAALHLAMIFSQEKNVIF